MTADVNSTATDDEGILHPTGSLQFDSVGHESTSMKLKHKKRIGTWNVRSLYAGKVKVVTAEAKRCKLDIIGLCEHRWAGQGHFTPEDGGKLLFSGTAKGGQSGVAVYLSNKVEKSLLGYNPIDDKIITVRLKGQPNNNYNVCPIYAPTTLATDEIIDAFYAKLQEALDKIPKSDMVVMIRDFNSNVGQSDSPESAAI